MSEDAWVTCSIGPIPCIHMEGVNAFANFSVPTVTYHSRKDVLNHLILGPHKNIYGSYREPIIVIVLSTLLCVSIVKVIGTGATELLQSITELPLSTPYKMLLMRTSKY